MNKNVDIAKLIEGSGEYTNTESLFFADIVLRSGEVYDAEITHNTEYDSNIKTGVTYFAAIINRSQEMEEEIDLGNYLKCRKISYNGIIKWIVIE